MYSYKRQNRCDLKDDEATPVNTNDLEHAVEPPLTAWYYNLKL